MTLSKNDDYYSVKIRNCVESCCYTCCYLPSCCVFSCLCCPCVELCNFFELTLNIDDKYNMFTQCKILNHNFWTCCCCLCEKPKSPESQKMERN